MNGAGFVVRGSITILVLLYGAAIAAPFVAPYDYAEQNRSHPNCPPSGVYVRPVSEWSESILYTYPMELVDPVRRRYAQRRDAPVPVHLLHGGHLFSTPPGAPRLFLLGTDGLGRDLFSRLVHGGRISLAIGVVGVVLSFAIGLFFGSIAGYAGGWVDDVLMRVVEIIMALPSLYFLIALAAVMPPNLSSGMTFLVIIALMSFIRWAGFARIIRGMVASLREADYVLAARTLGASTPRILLRHVIPATFSYTIVAATLSIPSFILGESALSLLGLGIQEPSASWGSLLADAQNVQNLVHYPWILTPGLLIFLTVMAFNFVGDYLRDRFDPRATRSLG